MSVNVIEALIFASPSPIAVKRLTEISGLNQKEIEHRIKQLNESYEKENRTFRIRYVAGGYQFFTLPAMSPFIKKLFQKRSQPHLTQAALEVLAIIAIMQPVTKPVIDTIRHIDSRYLVVSLLEKGLITVKGRDKSPGKPFLYGTTFKFLQLFGLKDIDELPKAEELEQFFENSHNYAIDQDQ
ncbi:SMC-Scp complex subunit ScpB [bacterium]|nr:SMC-Scp complex subunit ScpB [bacterium]